MATKRGIKLPSDKQVKSAMLLLARAGYAVSKKQLELLETDFDELSHTPFIVRCAKLNIYTIIGADNLHHASNKATKNFGNKWTGLIHRTDHEIGVLARMGAVQCSVAEFNELLKTL